MNTQNKSQYDAVIIGGGHNGLVNAAYLAKEGLKVAILEKRSIVGGCAITEEPWKGYKVSTLSYVNSLFHPQIIRDLDLKSCGFEMLPRNPSSFTPFPDGRSLLLGPDKALVHKEISKFSKKDADAYPEYEAMLGEMSEILEPMMAECPPNKMSFSDISRFGVLGFKKRHSIRKNWAELIRFLSGSASDMLEQWFESEQLKVTLATDAIIGANASPRSPGTAYVLFHHVMGECNGVKGVWGYMRGGMGGLTQSLAKRCQALGVDIYTNTGVTDIITVNGRATGAVTEQGREFAARILVSCADPNITFNHLIDKKELPEEFVRQVARINYDSASVKINLALDKLPDFSALPGSQLGPQHKGTIHICPDLQYIEDAYADSVAGRPSTRPILECTIPTTCDETLAPEGKHIMNIFSQYGPNKLRPGLSWANEREAYGDRVLDIMEEYAPGFKSSVIHRQIITPEDLENEYNLTGGNIFHGRMNLDQMFNMRPVPGYADYRTPIRGLYLCGSGAHPGGGVMGTPGWNASKAIKHDIARM